MKLKTLRAAAAGILFLLACDSAFAQVSINIGGPPVGWHQNRYWDGHRYWRRDEWNRRHYGPRRGWHGGPPHGGWRGGPHGGPHRGGPGGGYR